MRRQRSFKEEYRRRIERGLAAGKSRSAARGHPRAADLPKPPSGPIDRDDPRERALKLMRKGSSQAEAARATGVSVEQLRRYRLQHTTSELRHGRWAIFDSRPQQFRILSDGAIRVVILDNDEGSQVGHYWNAVNAFLASNDADHLAPYIGEGVYDQSGRLWILETRPNVLRRLDSVGELDFLEIYADVAA
jgi:hypothetical protein